MAGRQLTGTDHHGEPQPHLLRQRWPGGMGGETRTMTTTTLTDTIGDAIESVKASDCDRVDRNEREDRGGWINVTIRPMDGLTMRCGWWLHTSGNGLSSAEYDLVQRNGYCISTYSGNECDHDIDADLLDRLAAEFDCDPEEVDYRLSDMWEEHADDEIAEEVWAEDLRQAIEREAGDAEVRELLKMLDVD